MRSGMGSICGSEKKTWEHVWERCVGGGDRGKWQEMVGEVLGDERNGEESLRRVEDWRRMHEGMSEQEWHEKDERPETEVSG
ncbi:hypothetical protein PV325_010177 [Microctonus aethiopoides]|nr:hypothetical protein PV325_010177 [Microctonus aethiopoides]